MRVTKSSSSSSGSTVTLSDVADATTWSKGSSKATFSFNGTQQDLYVENGKAYDSWGNVRGTIENGHIVVTNKDFNSMFGNTTGSVSNSTTVNVKQGDHVTSASTYAGSNVTINNYGIMDTITTGKNRSLTLNNYGTVKNEVRLGENATAVIVNNKGAYIKDVIGGNITDKNSQKGINATNYGEIHYIQTGAYSTNEVFNYDGGYVDWLKTGYGNSSTTDGGTKYYSGQGSVKVISDLDKLKSNLYQLGYHNVYTNYTSARDQFLKDYYDHGHSLTSDFNRMGDGNHYSTLLSWTNHALNGIFAKVEIRVSSEKEFVEISKSWREKHGGNYTTWDEAKAVYAVYDAGFRESDFASYSDYEKAVFEANAKIADEKFGMKPEEFLAIMLGIFLEKGIKVRSTSVSKYEIEHPVLVNTRTGSGLKAADGQHGFNNIIDNYARDAKEFNIIGGDKVQRKLYQIEGGMKYYDYKDVYNTKTKMYERQTIVTDQKGVFEWIVDPKDGVTHRRFIPNGTITGSPNQRPN